MKPRLFATLFILLCCRLSAIAADDYVRESGWSEETFSSKVIKDLTFKDGASEYVAYLVKWKDHEVIVAARGPQPKHYAVGDIVRCQMMQRDTVRAGESQSQLTFGLASDDVDKARLEAVAAEVAARRAKREVTAAAAAATVPPAKK
jgi:hypothetical protein